MTGLQPFWQAEDNVTFLGPWCLDRPFIGLPIKNFQPAKSLKIFPFHWNDRKKLIKDYDYLEKLHKNLLLCLAKSLNYFHNKAYSLRYWQILLDPWLMAYLGAMFDRWESVRLAMLSKKEFTIPVFEKQHKNPVRVFSYNEFISNIISDVGNESIFKNIFKFEYSGLVELQATKQSFNKPKKPFTESPSGIFPVKKGFEILGKNLNWVTQKLTNSNKILFQDTYFSPFSIIRLSFSLRQFPKIKNYEFEIHQKEIKNSIFNDENKHRNINLQWQPKNRFELFLFSRIREDLPSSVVENFGKLLEMVVGTSLKPSVILSGNSHWGNPLAKAWMAEHTEKGGKLVVLEHGGSFPARKEHFNFEEDIADWKGTWFVPYHPKHVQVPPPKLIRARDGRGLKLALKLNKFCLIIGNENPKYVYRAMFYPMADQCLRSILLVNKMITSLKYFIQEKIKIRPYPQNMGWNSKALFEETYGSKKICSLKTIWQAFESAKIIVCTYPETTFSEAMTTGRPVILLFDYKINERHRVSFPLIKQMTEASIIFHNSEKAAEHINKIWHNPLQWWNSAKTLRAREKFKSQAGRIDADWVKEWKEKLTKD